MTNEGMLYNPKELLNFLIYKVREIKGTYIGCVEMGWNSME